MRPLEPFRMSNTVSFNLTPLLHKQAKHYATTHGLPLASVVRNAINAFTENPHKYRSPNIRALLAANPNLCITRDRTIGLTLLPQDRNPLDALSRATLLPNAALIRRATYEYTKTDAPACTYPEMILDAWGDQPLSALPKARPPEKRRKKKPTTNTRTTTNTHTKPAAPVDMEGFTQEFGEWL